MMRARPKVVAILVFIYSYLLSWVASWEYLLFQGVSLLYFARSMRVNHISAAKSVN